MVRIDSDGDNKVLKKGNIVTFEPGIYSHSSYTKNGCLILVFMRAINKVIINNVKKILKELINMIGILGGMGTQAGLDFCNKLSMLNRGKIDQKYPSFHFV